MSTGGYCFPCFRSIEAKKGEELIKKNRREVNLYENLNDDVEIIKVMHKKTKYDPLITYTKYPKSMETMYSNLTNEQINRLISYAKDLYIKGEDEWIMIILHLVCICNADVNELLEYVLNDSGEVYDEYIYANASDRIAELLIEGTITGTMTTSINHNLCALAIIANDRVVNQFLNWKEHGFINDTRLYRKAYEYSYQGGWELDEYGNKRKLYHDDCYPIVFKNEYECEDLSETVNIELFTKQEESCRWCGKKMIGLFSINDKNVCDEKLSIPVCLNCNCYGVMYSELDDKGVSHWSEYNEKPEYLNIHDNVENDTNESNDYVATELDEIRSNIDRVCFKAKHRSAYYAANQFLNMRFTKIGGIPTWIQDAEYPICPKCNKTMVFIGQVSMEDFEKYGEGIYYGFYCNKCRITAVNYQQT